MNDAMFNALRNFGGRHPRARGVAALLHNAIGGNRRKVKGRNNIESNGAFLRHVVFDVEGDSNHVRIHPLARIENTTIYVRGDQHQLTIGKECCFQAGSIWLQAGQCRIEIGAETTIEEAHLAATERGTSITIGCDCMLAFDVDIRNGDSHSIIDLASGERVNAAGNIRIGDHVWLGAHVEVLKGVTIGSGSVIGIRSVVTCDVPVNTVAAGIPARVIREGIRWDRQVL